jgi:hypothetical protein
VEDIHEVVQFALARGLDGEPERQGRLSDGDAGPLTLPIANRGLLETAYQPLMVVRRMGQMNHFEAFLRASGLLV